MEPATQNAGTDGTGEVFSGELGREGVVLRLELQFEFDLANT